MKRAILRELVGALVLAVLVVIVKKEQASE